MREVWKEREERATQGRGFIYAHSVPSWPGYSPVARRWFPHPTSLDHPVTLFCLDHQHHLSHVRKGHKAIPVHRRQHGSNSHREVQLHKRPQLHKLVQINKLPPRNAEETRDTTNYKESSLQASAAVHERESCNDRETNAGAEKWVLETILLGKHLLPVQPTQPCGYGEEEGGAIVKIGEREMAREWR